MLLRGNDDTADPISEERLESRIGVHDSTQFEVKLDYSIDSRARDNRYRVDCYFFVPRSLGVNRDTYSREEFYGDLHSYIRFRTPTLNLVGLADPDNPDSPLHHVRELIQDWHAAQNENDWSEGFSQEARMYGSIARARLRDRVRAFRSTIRRRQERQLTHLSRGLDAFANEVASVLASWRDVCADVEALSDPIVSETCAYVDEYLSVIVENKITALIRTIDSRGRGLDLGEGRASLVAVLQREREYRRIQGYQTAILADEEASEAFIYRRGVLKKFVMSVLWLEITRAKEGSGAANFGAAIAAGAAMFIALLATVLHSRWYLWNTSGFVVAATLTYILKDRIKDWLRHYLSSRLTGWLADYSVSIHDPQAGVDLGRCRESFRYLRPEDVPKPVFELRHRGADSVLKVMGKPEDVLHYQKKVHLKGLTIAQRLHLEDYDIHDIMRFSMQQFLARAHDPVALVPTFNPERDRVERRPFPKVYHVNVVLLLTDPAHPEQPRAQRVRVVFDKSGIKRLEDVC